MIRVGKMVIPGLVISVVAASVLFMLLLVQARTANAACTTLPSDKGIVTMTVNVPAAGTYRVWSRIMAPNSTDNSYILEVDDATCNVVVGDTPLPSAQWTWVDYAAGATSNKISLNLSQGNHTFRLIGREADVKLDRILLTTDTSCAPSGTGDNCVVVADNTPPSVNLTAPTNGAKVSGIIDISANATDNNGVTKVEFFLNGNRVGQDTTAPNPFTFNFDTASVPNGAHSLQAKAYDGAGNVGSSSSVSVTVENIIPDTTPPSIQLTAPTTGTVSGVVAMTANGSDDKGVAKVAFYVNNVLIGNDTAAPYTASWDTKLTSNATVNVYAVATDTSGNTATSPPTTVVINNPVPDTTPPSVPGALTGTASAFNKVNLSWTASTDNVGVVRYGVYRGGSLLTYVTTTSYVDTTVSASSNYTYHVKAFDAANNASTASNSVSVSTPAAPDTIPPSVTLTAPIADTVVKETIALSANAEDNKGIARVAFYSNNSLIGVDTTAPYSVEMDTALVPNGSATIKAVATDTSDLSTTSSSVTVTIQNVIPDTSPPTAPQNLQITRVGRRQINIAWQASTDNIGVVRYVIYRNNTRIASTRYLSYGDGNVQSGRTYTYKVIAVDAAGNRSTASNLATATTLTRRR